MKSPSMVNGAGIVLVIQVRTSMVVGVGGRGGIRVGQRPAPIRGCPRREEPVVSSRMETMDWVMSMCQSWRVLGLRRRCGPVVELQESRLGWVQQGVGYGVHLHNQRAAWSSLNEDW
ncbi:hypothetical protein FKM82_018703 [Ascaphus truei]